VSPGVLGSVDTWSADIDGLRSGGAQRQGYAESADMQLTSEPADLAPPRWGDER
jgi:hypothetical protein